MLPVGLLSSREGGVPGLVAEGNILMELLPMKGLSGNSASYTAAGMRQMDPIRPRSGEVRCRVGSASGCLIIMTCLCTCCVMGFEAAHLKPELKCILYLRSLCGSKQNKQGQPYGVSKASSQRFLMAFAYLLSLT